MDAAEIIFRAIFVDNLALNFLLGMCTYIAVSQRVATAVGLALAITVVQTITVPLNHLIYAYLLAPGAMRWLGNGRRAQYWWRWRYDMTDRQKTLCMNYVFDNAPKLRELTLRMVIKVASLIKSDPFGWEDTASITLMRNK